MNFMHSVVINNEIESIWSKMQILELFGAWNAIGDASSRCAFRERMFAKRPKRTGRLRVTTSNATPTSQVDSKVQSSLFQILIFHFKKLTF